MDRCFQNEKQSLNDKHITYIIRWQEHISMLFQKGNVFL
jgi:hypothetical protein